MSTWIIFWNFGLFSAEFFFYQRGNTNFSSYPNIRLLDIVTGDLTDVSYQKLTNSRILPLTHFLQSTNQMWVEFRSQVITQWAHLWILIIGLQLWHKIALTLRLIWVQYCCVVVPPLLSATLVKSSYDKVALIVVVLVSIYPEVNISAKFQIWNGIIETIFSYFVR